MTRPLSKSLVELKKALSDDLPAIELSRLVNTVCEITEDLISTRAGEELGLDVASFFDQHNGVLYILQHCEINISIKKRLLSCLKIILKLQCPYLECYANEIWGFFNNYLYSMKVEQFDENLFFDICNALPNSKNEIVQTFNYFIHQILPTFSARPVEKIKILCALLKRFPEKRNIDREDVEFLFSTIISRKNWCKGSVQFVLMSLHLLKESNFYDSLFQLHLNHIFDQMTEWLQVEKILNKQISDSWTLFVKDNFIKFERLIFSNACWFTQMERLVNSTNENVMFSLKAQCARQYFKCLLKHNDNQLLVYYKVFLKEFENKQAPLSLFALQFFKLFIPWKYCIIPSEDQLMFNDTLINHLYWRFGYHEYSYPLGDYLELMSSFFVRSRNLFNTNMLFYKNILFQTAILYPKSDCKEELESNIFASLYIYDSLSGNVDSIVHECLIKQCSHKWVANYEKIKKLIHFNTYHQYIPFWINILNFHHENSTIDISNKEKYNFCEKLLSSFIKLLEHGFQTSLELNFNKSQNSQGFTKNATISTYNVDITIFENLSALFCCVMYGIYEQIPPPLIADLFRRVTCLSKRNPNIQGLYAVIAACLDIMKKHNYILNFDLNNDLFNLKKYTFDYFNYLFQDSQTFDDKLSETFETIISIPVKLVPYFSSDLLLFFMNIFHNHFYGLETVYKSLNAIYSWITVLGLRQLEDFLRELIPSLRKILLQFETGIDNDIILKNTSNCYNCILKLLALFSQDLISHLFDRSPSVEVQSSHPLSLQVPLQNLPDLTIRIDCIIPHAMLLVSETANGKVKQSSCELLHSLCIFCLGTSAQLNLLLSDGFKTLVNSLIDTMVSSSYPSDGVVCRMFECLLFEICHLFATRLHYYSNFASTFIDILLKGMSNTVNSGGKKLSVKCIAEFIIWTTKSENNDIIVNNSRELVTKKICYYFLHGCTNGRLGAATGFNCIAETVLKERDYVNKYAIYIIFYVITSLETYDEKNSQIEDSLELLQTSVIEFFEPDSFRERLHPEGIENPTMQSLLKWLLEKCTTSSYECRCCCMKMINTISEHHKETINVSELFSDNLKNYLGLCSKITGMESPGKRDILNQLSMLNIALEYFEFHVSKVGTNPQLLELISKSIHDFFGIFDNLGSESDLCSTLNEINKYKMKQCTMRGITSTIVRIFANQSDCLDDIINSNPGPLIDFISLFFTCPSELGYFGYDVPDLVDVVKIVKNLSILKSTLLNQLVQKYNHTVDLILNMLKSPSQEKLNVLSNLVFLFQEINKCDIIEAWKWSPFRIINHIKQLVIDDKIKLNQINYQGKEMLSKILDVSISRECKKGFWFWNIFCFEDRPAFENYCLTTEFGFFLTFKDVLCNYVVTNFDVSSFGNLNFAKLVIIKEVLGWAEKVQHFNTFRFGNNVLNYFIKWWRETMNWFEMCPQKKNETLDFLYVLAKTVRVCFNSKSKLGNWIWLEFNFNNINCIKLLPYLIPPSSDLIIARLEKSDLTKCFLQEKLLYSFQCSSNTSLISFILSNNVQEMDENHINNMLMRMPKEVENTLMCDIYSAILWSNGGLNKRLYLFKSLFVPLCYKAGLESTTGFYIEKLKELNKIILTDLQPRSPPGEEEKLLIGKQIIAFIALETMFGVLKTEYVHECIKQGFGTDNPRNLVKQILLCSYNVRKSKPHELSEKNYCEYWRQLQCSAFNCTAAIICNTKNNSDDEKFYAKFIFKEDREKWMIWDNITYKQEDIVFHSYEERKRTRKIKVLTSLQSKNQLDLQENMYKVGPSFSLSTFSQDCKTFDFIGSTDIPVNEKCAYQEFEFKRDQFNEHECMGILCGVLHNMVNIGVVKSEEQMPLWMSSLFNSFTFPNLRVYGKLLILTLILNTREIFKPYAQYWLLPIIVTVNSIVPPLPDEKLNYMLSDIIVMLISWRDVAIPRPSFQIWALVEKVIASSANMSRPEAKQNLYLITEIMVHWGSSVKSPKLDSVRQLIKSKDIRHNKLGLHIVQLLLDKVQPMGLMTETNFDEFLQMIDNVDQDIFKLSAEILGLLLRHSVSEESRLERQIKIVDVLSRMHIKQKAKFFLVFYHIQKHYPLLCHKFISHIITNLNNQCYNDTYIMCLNALNGFLDKGPELNRNILKQLKDCFTLINTENEKVLCSMLQVTLTCFQKYDGFSLISFEDSRLLADHCLKEDARGKLCDLLISVYIKHHVPNCREEGERMKGIESYLFLRLFDKCAQIQSKMLEFWVKDGVLSPDAEKALLFLLEYALKTDCQKGLVGMLTNVLIKYLEKYGNFSNQVFQFALADYNNGQVCQIQNEPFKISEDINCVPKFVIIDDSVHKKAKKGKSIDLPSGENTGIQYRYYHGNYPCTKIVLNDIINPLTSLALLDEDFAQKLFLALSNGICALIKKKDSWVSFKTNFTALFDIIKRKPALKNKIHYIMLEIAISNNICFNLNDTITDMFINNRLHKLGILFAENCIIDDHRVELSEESSKRIKLSSDSHVEPYISTIIRLYLSINEDGVAADIFDDYVSKEEIYRNQSQQDLSSLFKLKKCYALFDWESLDKLLIPEGESCISAWNTCDLNSRKPDILPYVVKMTAQQTITGRCDAQPLKLEKLTSFTEDFGTELSLFYLSKDDFTNLRLNSELSLKRHITDFKNEFLGMKFSIYEYILKLKCLIDLYMLSTAQYFYLSDFVDEYHNAKLKFYGDQTNYLDYRAFCREILHVNGHNCTDENPREWPVNMIDYAISKSNFYLARKYLVKLHKKSDDNLETPRKSIINKIKLGEVSLLKLKMLNDTNLKLESLKTNWKGLSELMTLANENPDCFSERKMVQIINHYISALCSELIESNSDCAFTENIHEMEKTIQLISPNTISISTYFTLNHAGEKELLFQLGLQCLINSAEYDTSASAGKAYFSASMFCKKYFGRFQYDKKTEIFFIRCLLRAIKLGCEQARLMFPLIFTYKNVFMENIDELYQVPDWMMLKWLPQIFVKLNDSSSKVLLPLIDKLYKNYPYDVSISFIMLNDVCEDDSLFKKMSAHTECLLMTKRIVNALNQLCHPTILLCSYLKKLISAYKTNRSVESIYNEIYEKCFYTTGNKTVGKIYEMNKPHFDFVQAIQKKRSNDDLCMQLERKIKELHQNILNIDETRLDQFCPWLANFTTHVGSFDIPCTASHSCENPPKLLGFGANIQLISSLRRPIKITMLGSDGRSYKWLVKFGEDLRSDQRVRQIFDCMNHSFRHVSEMHDCRVNIYQVMPLKHNFGLIEWLDNTSTMSDFINKSLSQEEIKLRYDIRKWHEKWILVCDADNYCRAHNIAIQRYTETDFVNQFEILCQKLPSRLIKKSLTRMSLSAYDYYKFRTTFLNSYSVLSACQWILGISDRHLKNILINSNCEVIGIDYNYAFDLGLRFLPIPELVPFRMTPQFYDVYLPLGKSGILHQTMINVIDSVEKDVILSVVKLFSEEHKFLEYNINKCTSESLTKGISTFLKDIVQVIDCKLEKENPLVLMEDHLRKGLLPKHIADVYTDLLKAEFGKYSKNLTTKALVNCLVQISTNKRILGLSLPIFESWI